MLSRPLLLTGMHRSGTSLIADYIQRCGVNIGDDLEVPDIGNPRGYHEDTDFLRFHQDLLRSLGEGTFPTKDLRLNRPVPEKFLVRAQQIVDSKRSKQMWGWKECRTVLFLEMWRKLIPRLAVVFLFRHPLDVVDSLVRRGTDEDITKDPAIGFQSWFLYNSHIIRYSRKYRESVFLVNIRDIIQHPEETVARISAKMEIPLLPAKFDEVYAQGEFQAQSWRRSGPLVRRFPLQILRCLALYYRLERMADHR